MTGNCSCNKKPNDCNKCKPPPCSTCHKPEPVCYTCTKPLYDIITYYDICIPCFNVAINTCNKRIEGFILTFVDECGFPICFDDCESYMSVEILTECGPRLVTCDNKIFYTYTEQHNNCMPLNTALWTLRYPTSATLLLSFRLKHCYMNRIRLNINMFYGQNKCPEEKLGPVVCNAIESDKYTPCVKDSCYPGYVGWMVSLKECCEQPTYSNNQQTENSNQQQTEHSNYQQPNYYTHHQSSYYTPNQTYQYGYH